MGKIYYVRQRRMSNNLLLLETPYINLLIFKIIKGHVNFDLNH